MADSSRRRPPSRDLVTVDLDASGGATRRRALRVLKQYVPSPGGAALALAALGAAGYGAVLAWPYVWAVLTWPLYLIGGGMGLALVYKLYRLYSAWWMVGTASRLLTADDD